MNLKNAVAGESLDGSLFCIASVGADLSAYILPTVRIHSHLQTSQLLMKWLSILSGLCLIILSFAPAPAQAAQEIRPFVRGSYQQIVSAYQTKPFIVNFWSLTCNYCMVELAMFKKLVKKYPGVNLVLVSTDTPEEGKEISATLKKFSLGKAEAWVFADSYIERLRFEVDRKWQGELPRTYFFGTKGEVTAISGKLEYGEAEQWIRAQHASR